MNTYDYLSNYNTKTDATITGILHSPVQVEVQRYQSNDWMTLETRKFETIEAARNWATWRIK